MNGAHEALIVDYIRTPIGRFGGALSSVRPDDLSALTIAALLERSSGVDPSDVDEIILGCANQAGEDNRNVARMAGLLAGVPTSSPGVTINRLCASGLEAVAQAARMIAVGEADLVIAGGVESMSRAPYVMPKSEKPFSREASIADTTIGWRLVNRRMVEAYGIDSMPETAENVAEQFSISRADQDAYALRSQQRALAAQDAGRFAPEITPVAVSGRRGVETTVDRDEHPRATTFEKLGSLPTPFREGGTVTAGNASGVNDGAAAVLLASPAYCKRRGLTPSARVLGAVSAGVEPRIMGVGPVPATRRLMERLCLTIDAFDVIELNEAFAAQALAVLRELDVDDDADHVNPNGGAIALGHPLGMSGARLVGTAMRELERRSGRYALATMCVGVGQGSALAIERIGDGT